MRTIIFHKIAVIALLIWAGSSSAAALSESASSLTIETANQHEVHHFTVELALSNSQRIQGLMYRTELGSDQGMLFIFPDTDMRSFWMRNTLIPLDIIFLKSDGTIINIIENAEPETETPRRSEAPAKAVLEIAGGHSAKLGLSAGDIVRHVLLGNLIKGKDSQ
ncbi:DUF192 domain-containing protein [Kordiimonas pumila]|uniref:DUF192 domain-containing protein n=1 Tax=Kordiimonas pumila TaxID=2161677 RepID=A0ABV7D2G2_9PROT|nr:DUF192 domain-containing protein [Kordiimonas pumila]